MKNISEIQNIIKNEERLCIFIDYNTLAENLERMYASDARESRGLRIVRNFLNCPFLQIYVIVKKNTPKKAVNYVKTKFPEINIIHYEKETFEQLCSEIDSNYAFLYVGNNEDVINMDRFQNGYTISLSYSLKQTCKTVHFQLSIEELAELLLETNNICL